MLQSLEENSLIDTVEDGWGNIRERNNLFWAGNAEKSESPTHFKFSLSFQRSS